MVDRCLVEKVHARCRVCINCHICLLVPWFFIVNAVKHGYLPYSSFVYVDCPRSHLGVLFKELRSIQCPSYGLGDVIFKGVTGPIASHQIVDVLLNKCVQL